MLGQVKEYTGRWLRLADGEPRERFRARWPTTAEYQKFAEDREACFISNGTGAAATRAMHMSRMFDAARRHAFTLLTGYEIEGHETPPNWRDLLEADGRYVQAIAEIGLDLFRQAEFERDGGVDPPEGAE